MATYINKGIQYSRVTAPGINTSGMITKGSYTINSINRVTKLPGKLLNVIDIDFNDALIDNGATMISDASDFLIRLGNTYTKEASDAKYQEKGNYLTEHQSLDGYLTNDMASNMYQPKGDYLTEHQSLDGLATQIYVDNKISDLVNNAPEALDTLKEIADKLANGDTVVESLTNQISIKANASDVYTKDESDAKYLTEHQDITGKANVGDSYTKDESDAKYLTEHQDITGKANVGDSYTKDESDAKYLTEHQDITGKANIGDSYTKDESDAKYLTEHQDITNKANVGDSYTKDESDAKYLTEHQSLDDYTTKEYVAEQIESIQDEIGNNEETIATTLETLNNKFNDYSTTAESQEYVDNKIADIIGSAPEALNTLEEIAAALENNATLSDITAAIANKANVGDSYTKAESDAKYLTEHQDISGLAVKSAVDTQIDQLAQQLATYETQVEETYATQDAVAALIDNIYTKEESNEIFATNEQVESIIGNAPENFTIEDVANAMSDLKVVDVEAVEGVHYTQEEIDAAQEGDDAYGKTVDDWKVEPVEEVSHSMTIGEYVSDAIADKANVGDSYTKAESDAKYLTEHQDITGKANVGDSYTKAESDERYLIGNQPLDDYATKEYVDEQVESIMGNAPENFTIEDVANAMSDLKVIDTEAVEGVHYTQEEIDDAQEGDDAYGKTVDDWKVEPVEEVSHNMTIGEYVSDAIADIVGSAPETLDTLEEIAAALENNATLSDITTAIANKANVGDSYTKAESDAKYATKEYVDNKVESLIGDVPENFDTLKELADAMGDLKVVDVEAIEPVEGVHWTQEEIDAAVEGDEAYGKTVDDWKVEPVEGVEEVSHNMTIGEFVNSSMQAVDEKEAVAKVQAKYNALITLLNLRETDINNVMINEELTTSSTVTFDEPVDNVVIPETTAAYVVTAPLEDNATVTLTSNKYMTLDNTSEEPVSATVQRPAEAGESGTTGTTVYLVGQYDTLTLENVSPNVKSGRDAAVVNNVIITENNIKNLTLNLDLQDGATITNNSATAVTINDKNNEETVLAIVAPNSTVTLNGGTYTTLDAEVSDNTLVIKRNAHIGTLNVTKGNVKVEVARQSDIASVIDNVNIAEGYSIDYLHDDITSANVSKLTTTGTHTLQENITKSGNFSVGLFSTDDMVWNLNGHNLTSSNTRGYGIFTLRGTAQLEINDTVGTGVIKNTADEYGFWTSTVGSKVVINGGNFEAATHVLYAQKGTIEVNGGTFKLTDAATADKDQNGNFKFLLNCHDADYVSGDAKIIVRGGKFYGFDPSNTYGEPGGPVSYVPEGYESVPTNEAYEYGTVYEVKKITQ